MSDKRANSDIEDVLSSVLRLVSEDLRVPGRVPTVPAPEPEAKLVLTPDQRVAASAAAATPLPAATMQAVPTPLVSAALDDAALRELIRDVLREELRGPLGVRITRNVRKLVLAEVQRALASRDVG